VNGRTEVAVVHRESKKGGYNVVSYWPIFKILSLLQRTLNFQQNPY